MLDTMSLHHNIGSLRRDSARSPDDGRGAFFMRAYGGDYRYASNLAASQYGYDADIRYGGLQMGGNFYGFETANGLINFGLTGSYGDLSYKPRKVEDLHKTELDVWNVAPYMSWQHNSGFYVDAVIAYGGFKGDVSTSWRGRAAQLKGHGYTASFEAGMPFTLPVEGLTFEPQAQILYQRLSFDSARDIDGFPIDIGNPDQWTVRLGGQLSKDFVTSAGSNIALYGKFNVIHSFDDNNHIWLGDNFQSGRFGTHLETGVGINAALFGKASLYGDLTWAERVSSAGSSGITLNGGFKAKF